MGGRNDPTNIINTTLLALFGVIDLDHSNYLGNSVEDVAYEKAGIIKKGCSVVTYPQSTVVKNILNTEADLNKVAVLEVETDKVKNIRIDKHLLFDYGDFFNIELNSLGEYQALNAAVAIEAALMLKSKYGFNNVNEILIKKSLRKSYWEGRMELVSINPRIIIDGAHNENGILGLFNSLKYFSDFRKVHSILCGFSSKKYENVIEIIQANSDYIHLYESHYAGALTSYDFSENFNKKTFLYSDVEEAIDYTINSSTPNDIILLFGDLFSIVRMKEHILRHYSY